MALFIGTLFSCWGLGYALGFQIRMVRDAIGAA